MTVDLPQRFETDRPVPGDPITRAEELIIKEARRRHRRRVMFRVGMATLVIAGLGTGVVVLAGHRASRSATSPLLARPGRPTPTDARCQTGELQIVALRGLAGMGQRSEVMSFRNVSRASCTLHGYPLVVALGANGSPGATARPTLNGYGGGIASGATGLPSVILEPGQSASATIGGEGIPSGSETSCPSYASFLVTPPGSTRSIPVASWGGPAPGPFPGCQSIIVTPIVPGASGSIPASLIPVPTSATSISGSAPTTTPTPGGPSPTTTP